MEEQTKKLEPTILFEDQNVVVLNKPAGLVVHPDGKREEYTLCDWLLEKYPEIKEVGEPMTILYKEKEVTIFRPGIVHRLDKETSGVIIVAKNQYTYFNLKKQFEKHTIRKTYRAFLYGWLKEDIGIINAPIGRSTTDIRAMNAGRGARGELREAITRFRVIKRFTDNGEDRPDAEHRFTYAEVYPMTGRTHQIRVHFRYVHYPIVSDFLYAHNKKRALGFDRVALHALALEVTLPEEKAMRRFEAPLPADFIAAERLA